MTRRYPHYITRAHQSHWPGTILCVDCVGEPYQPDAHSVARCERLVSVACVRLSSHDQTYGISASCVFADAQSWWEYLCDTQNAGGTVWVYSYRCGRVWSLLDLWGCIESGAAQMCGRNHRNSDTDMSRHGRSVSGSGSPGASRGAGQAGRRLARESGYLVIEDPPCIARFRLRGSKSWIQWVDSRNYGVDIGGDTVAGHATAYMLSQWLIQFRRASVDYGLGALCATAASQALRAWRTTYLKGTVYCHEHKQAGGLESDGYYGGRCESYHIGPAASPVWHLDYRSMYPSVCRDSRLPCRLQGHILNPSRGDAERHLAERGVIARVKIETDEPAYPYRCSARAWRGDRSQATEVYLQGGSTDTDIIYPIGRFTTTLCGPELQDAQERGRIVEWQELAYYALDYSLRDYARSLYALRQSYAHTDNTAMLGLAKRLLVSLPGKLGQRDRRWVHTPGVCTDIQYGYWWGRDDDGAPCRYRSIAGHVCRDVVSGWSYDAVPAIAAYVTSAGRMLLLSAIRCAGWREVLYYDTDALITTEMGYERLGRAGHIRAGQLGCLQILAAKVAADIRGIKHYTCGARTVCAGVHLDPKRDRSPARIVPASIRAADQIRVGRKPAAILSTPIVQRAPAYHHGVVHADGSVTPHAIEEW